MHNHPISDIAEMLKEEFSELKLYMKPQPVQYYDIVTMSWFMKLYPKVDIPQLHKFFLVRVKRKVKDPDFVLVVKIIFSSAKADSSSQARSFIKHNEQCLKAVYI